MTLQQLNLLKNLIECGSISKAAQLCFLSQSALTRQIQVMEKEIGFPLFERSYNGVKPTHPGFIFYEEIKPILVQYEKALRLANQAYAASRQTGICIGSYYYLMNFIAPACHHCHSQDPRIDFSFISCRLCEVLDYLENKMIDMGVFIDFLESIPSFIHATPIAYSYNICKIPCEHPLFGKEEVSIQDLNRQTILLPRRQTENVRRIREYITQAGLDIKIQYFETPDQADTISLAKKNIVFILPPFLSSDQFHHAVISDLPKPVMSILIRKEEQETYQPVVEMLKDYFVDSLVHFPGLLPF